MDDAEVGSAKQSHVSLTLAGAVDFHSLFGVTILHSHRVCSALLMILKELDEPEHF